MKKEMIYFGEPNIGEDEIHAVERVLRSKWIGFGKESVAFEQEIKTYVNARHGVLVNSCTSALHLAVILAGVKEGDEVITTPFTFAATANVILYRGAKPVFVDVRADTFNIDENKIVQAITPKTKAIIVVHFGGLPCNMAKINAIAKKHNLIVIEDAAHAIGAKIGQKMIGDSKNFVCFSFYSNKNLTSIEGGFLTVRNKDEALRAEQLRLHGLSNDAWKRFSDKKTLINEVAELGHKHNITDVQSAVGRVQLKKYEKNFIQREKIIKLYDSILFNVPNISFQVRPSSEKMRSSVHLYMIKLNPEKFRVSRDEIVHALRDEGIFAVVHYHPIHLHKFYRDTLGHKKGGFPIAETIAENVFTLPLLPQLPAGKSKWIAEKTREVLLQFQFDKK